MNQDELLDKIDEIHNALVGLFVVVIASSLVACILTLIILILIK